MAAGATPGAGPRSPSAARRPRAMPLRAAAAAAGRACRASRRRPARRRATAQRSRSSAPGTRPARNSAGSGRFPVEPGPELALLLADLGSRLAALVTWLSGLGIPAGQLAGLDNLAGRLRFSRDGRPGTRRAAGGGACGAGRFRGGRPRWSVGTRAPRQHAIPAAGREYLLEAPRLTHAARWGTSSPRHPPPASRESPRMSIRFRRQNQPNAFHEGRS